MSNREMSERSKFYLRHRKRIQQWAALESDAANEAHRFYCSLAGPLEDVSGLRGDPSVFLHLERTEPPKLFLVKEAWAGPDDGGHPLVGIGIEWPKKTSFTNACTGIWVNRYPATRSLADLLGPLIAAKAERVLDPVWPKYKIKPQGWFPVLRYEKPHREDYWDDLDGYASALIERICDLWDAMSDEVQAAVEEVKA